MKTSKKILATIVAIMLVVTSMSLPTFAAFTDLETGAASYTAATVLNNLGVINGYPDGSFGPDKNVTRAEFTAMLLRTRGMGSIGSTSLENPPFPDVTTSDVSWAIANIRTAYEMGIINGYDDGTFKPNNDVLYEEAVKMIVCALGYGDMGVDSSVWYAKYITTATSLGFTSGAGGAIGTPATRAVIANMLYNCLEVNLAENNTITNKTVLENDLNLTKNVGYISANSEISLTQADPNLRADEVEITIEDAYGALTTATYKVDDTSKYEDMLGAQITFYYTTDRNSGYKYLTLATVKNTETIEIPATDIYGSTGSSIEYLKNSDDSKTTIVSVNPNAVVVYNGKLYSTTDKYTDFESDKGMPTIGSVKLLDRDGDNKYDVVFVEDYEAWVVSSVTSSDKTISDNILRSNGKLVLDSEKVSGTVKIVDKNGAETTFSSISKGSVVSVKTDSYGNITAVVTNDSVSGKITATDSKKGVTINSKTYKFSNQAPWKNGGSLAEPIYGDSGKFYLDIDGNIIAYDKTEVTVTQYYGYMTIAELYTENFTEELKVAISTKNDTKASTAYTVTTKSKINGVTVTSLSAAETELQSALGGVKFTLSNGNEIDDIVTSTATTKGETIEVDTLYLYKKGGVDENTNWTYSASSSELTAKEGDTTIARIRLSGSTILHVPTPGSSSKNKILGTSDMKDGAATYKIEAFDVTTTDTAKFVIVYGELPEGTTISSSTEIMVVKSYENTVDDNGNSVRTLTGDIDGSEVIRSILISKSEDVAAGDMVRITKEDNQYMVKSGDVIYKKGDSHPGSGYPIVGTSNSGSVNFKAIWGSVHAYDDTTFVMAPTILGAGVSPNISDEISIAKSYFSGAKFYEIDTKANDEIVVDRTSDGYENILKTTLKYTESGEDQTEVFIYMNSNYNVKVVLIIKK